jgi:uncharacterized small protein (DUF1192 family)
MEHEKDVGLRFKTFYGKLSIEKRWRCSSMPSVEERLASLEEEVARLKAAKSNDEANALPWWEKIRGTFKDDPDYAEAMRLGRQWRESFRPKEDNVAKP